LKRVLKRGVDLSKNGGDQDNHGNSRKKWPRLHWYPQAKKEQATIIIKNHLLELLAMG